MSLRKLKAALAAAEFLPHTLTLGPDPDLDSVLPAAAAAFARDTWPRLTPSELMAGGPWGRETLNRYRRLEEDERTAVLAFAGFHNHELAHRVDLLSTPFGASFQGRACLETIGLLLEGAELLSELEKNEPQRPLRDLSMQSAEFVVSDGPATLNARIRWFDALRGAAPKYIQNGWDGSPKSLRVAGEELAPVTVHELLPTVAVPGTDRDYVRPLTILESRAVALTGLFLLHRLGGDEYAAREVARLLESLYSPSQDFPDYRFLIDLFLRIVGHDDLTSVAEERGTPGLTALFRTIAVVGWYGLHAPPEARPEATLNSSPMLRVMLAMQELVRIASREAPSVDGVTLMEQIDSGEQAAQLGLTEARETLAYSRDYLAVVRSHNQATNPHPELRSHFERNLSLQQAVLQRRIEHGYRSFAGMPEDGSVRDGVAAEEAEERLGFESQPPPAAVSNWFRLRQMLLFGRARPPGFWSELWSTVGVDAQVPALPPLAAREMALERARFVAGGVWPVYAIVAKRVLIAVDERKLPRVFADPSELRLETAWGCLPAAGEAIVALQISFPDVDEELRLLFLEDRHREVLDPILREGSVTLASIEAYNRLRHDDTDVETIVCTIEAPTDAVTLALAGSPVGVELVAYEHGWSTESLGSDIAGWAVECYGWRVDGEAALFEAELRTKPPKTVLLSAGSRDGFAGALVASGPPDAVRSFRTERFAGTGGEILEMTEAEARQLISDSVMRAQNALADRGLAPYRFVKQKPLEVELD